jgi:transforming growth factor-beta-induced protein
MRKNPFSILRYSAVIALVASLFLISGCDDDEKPTKTVYELISEDPDLSKLKEQIDAPAQASLKASLQGTADVTFFAPTNAAMATLLTTLGLDNFASISNSAAQAVLSYHLLESLKMSGDINIGDQLTTKQSEKITVTASATGEKQFTTGSAFKGNIVTADIRATNGVMHTVDLVLVPPTLGAVILQTLGKVAQPILLSSTFTTLAAAIQKADAGKPAASTIIGLMVASPGITVFAPSNAVFTGANLTVDSKTAAEWDAIIRGHIILETLATLPSAPKATANQKQLTLTSTTVQGTANAAAITVAVSNKISSQNGVVYPIGGIILNQ